MMKNNKTLDKKTIKYQEIKISRNRERERETCGDKERGYEFTV